MYKSLNADNLPKGLQWHPGYALTSRPDLEPLALNMFHSLHFPVTAHRIHAIWRLLARTVLFEDMPLLIKSAGTTLRGTLWDSCLFSCSSRRPKSFHWKSWTKLVV